MRGHFDSVRKVKIFGDGKLVASASEDGMVKLWDMKHDQEALYTFRGHTGSLFSLTSNNSVDPRDAILYSAGIEGVIRVWQIPSLKNK